MSEYVLEMTDIEKSFPGVRSFEGRQPPGKTGEVHALMGENGAGKSTLMKILMGIYTADAGTVLIDGKKEIIRGPKSAMEHGISMIHQELNPVLDMQVYENVYMGRELKRGPGLVDKKREQKRDTEIIGIAWDSDLCDPDDAGIKCRTVSAD